MPTTLTNGIQLPDKGSVDWYSSMQSNYNLIDTHLGDTDVHVTAEDKANWNSKQGSLSQDQLDAIAQVATNTDDIATLQSSKADASHTHSSSDITDIDDYATKDYVDNSISDLVDNAPDALNTLNELSAALNDDSNFASTVTTALAGKADSADLATVATSGSYTDLDDKPTIPTNTSDLTNDSDFVVSSDLATVATSGDYDDLSNKPSIPTNTSDLNNDSGFVTLNDFDIPSKTSDLTNDSGFITSSDVPTSTSDLTNDSNFVDTSNPAVSSGITSAKVTDYDTHIADTDIHVTTADKNKWNNQTYVFRYSSTALTPSSTNSNALLDNTDNLKVGDKVIDSSGVLFSITAIDTQNSTFTIGTALIDLAQDSDVVHKSGDETVGGEKTFANNKLIVGRNTDTGSAIQFVNADVVGDSANGSSGFEVYGSSISDANKIGSITIGEFSNNGGSYATIECNRTVSGVKSSNAIRSLIRPNGLKELSAIVDNDCKLGTEFLRWSKIYGTEYYYGSNNVEFSTKFVTTDTNQTISGNKTFSSNVNVYNSDSSTDTANIVLKNSKVERGSTTDISEQNIFFLDKNNAQIGNIKCNVDANGYSNLTLQCSDTNDTSSGVQVRKTPIGFTFRPTGDNQCWLGQDGRRWFNTYTSRINNLEPSSLSLPSGNFNDVIDISSYLVNLDGTDNTYIAPANGWITIKASTATGISCTIPNLWNDSRIRTSAGVLKMLFPILKGQTVYISIYATTVDVARFIPCQGNV